MLITKDLCYDSSLGRLFEGVSVSLDGAANKRVAIVGRNGCGKSTFLKLLKGEIEPTAGTVSRANEEIAYLKQEIVFEDDQVSVLKYLEGKLEEDWMTYKVEIVLEEVGLAEEAANLELGKLSGGQRVKVALAELLLMDPTILLLDEPTNHLDTVTIDWLKGFVKNFSGSVAFVSHDRSFINAVADTIWEINNEGRIEAYGCSYDQFLVERFNRYQKRLADFEFSQREVTELENWLRENANHPKYKFTATVAQKKKALERMEKKAPPEPVQDPKVKMQNLDEASRGMVLNLKLEKKDLGGRSILTGINLKVDAGERILIKGPNGSGKTTLLNILGGVDKDYHGQIKHREGANIGYLKQFCALNMENTVLNEFSEKSIVDYTLGRSVLASYLFPADLVGEKIKKLSYGQQRRLELAIMLVNKPDLLLLDEPTNHLDLFLREELERFLLQQSVAMCVISHDEYFIFKIKPTQTFLIEG